MNQKQMPPQAITLNTVFYVLFRRKWLILSISLVSIAAAVVVDLKYPFPFTSEAKIAIRYVSDPRPQDFGPGSSVTTADPQNHNVMGTELEIVSGRNVARMAATLFGPQRILGIPGSSNNVDGAAAVIAAGLAADVPKNEDVIVLNLTMSDPAIVQPLLNEIVSSYRTISGAIHTNSGMSESGLDEAAALAGGKVTDAEKRLTDIYTTAGIVDLDNAKKSLDEEKSRLMQSYYDARDGLAEQRGIITMLQSRFPEFTNTAPHAATNVAAPAAAGPPQPSEAVKVQYAAANHHLEQAQEELDKMLHGMTTNAPVVQLYQQEVEKARADKTKFESDWPSLVNAPPQQQVRTILPGGPQTGLTPAEQYAAAIVKASGLEARIFEASNNFNTVSNNIASLNALEPSIRVLRQQADNENKTFQTFLAAAAQSRTQDYTGVGKVSGIIPAEDATPPARDGKKIMKAVAGVGLGGILLSLGLAFGIEMGLNRTFRSSVEVQAALSYPFFVSIPIKSAHNRLGLAGRSARLKLPPSPASPNGSAPANGSSKDMVLAETPDVGKIEPWDEGHALRPHFETLRDRLIAYFEMINLTHKPKLVAVTSCGRGAGVTTAAAGLAASLSETGDGNVLLVDMNVQDGEAHHFYKGKLTCGLDEVLEAGKRADARVQGNLYVAKEAPAAEALPRALPKRFSNLVPKMKASDFDYIIFDMPPVSQISITPRLARFMDMVLMVVESDKTDRDLVRQAAGWLSESKATVGLILNKTRAYLPRKLQQEL